MSSPVLLFYCLHHMSLPFQMSHLHSPLASLILFCTNPGEVLSHSSTKAALVMFPRTSLDPAQPWSRCLRPALTMELALLGFSGVHLPVLSRHWVLLPLSDVLSLLRPRPGGLCAQASDPALCMIPQALCQFHGPNFRTHPEGLLPSHPQGPPWPSHRVLPPELLELPPA